MDSESYWEKRMEELEQHWYDKGRQTIEQELTSLYEDALEGIQDDIAVLYGRFVKDNNLSIGDAMALLQGREYRKWRKSIEEYVKEINETGDKGLERELNTLAMRSRITRLDKLYAEVLMALDALGRKADKAMTAYLTDAYQDGYYHSLFEIGKKRGLEGSVSRISEEDAEKVVRTPWSGENYSKRLWNNTEKLGKTIQQVVSSGVHRGLSVQKLSKMVEERMGVGHRQAVRLVRTEMNFSLNRSILDGIKASGMKYYRFVATLDRRTSAQCRAHDGHVYKVEDYSPGTNAPPLHPHCRSTIVGSLKGDSAPKGQRAARDAEGKYIRVPADMNYVDWKAVYIDKTKTHQEWRRDDLFERKILQDVTANFLSGSKRGKGTISIPPQSVYSRKDHREEIRVAKILQQSIGGNIELLAERNYEGLKTPDYNWDGALWDLKTISSPKAVHSAIRKGLRQIDSNPGGLILWERSAGIGLDDVIVAIADRLYRSAEIDMTLILGKDEGIIKILRYTKKK